MLVYLSDILVNQSPISRSLGKVLYEFLDNSLKKDQEIILSFKNVENLSSAFLNASIGKLYLDHSHDLIDSTLKCVELQSSMLQQKLDDTITSAKDFDFHKELVETATL